MLRPRTRPYQTQPDRPVRSVPRRHQYRRGGPALRLALGLALVAGSFTIGSSVVASTLLSGAEAVRYLPPATSRSQPDAPDRTGAPDEAGEPFWPDGGGAGLPHQVPVTVSIPRVGVAAPLTRIELAGGGTPRVRADDNVAGWYSGGPAPGDTDGPPAVIVGHVDSYLGPAVLLRLRQVRPGDEVRIGRADGSTAVFEVYRVAEYPKPTFPADQVYAPTRRAELRLITCTGSFDPKTRSYSDNLVAYAALRSAATVRGTPDPAAP